MVTVILGAQWGDEGKGKLTDILCANASLCARAQGGNNAGHTIVANNQKYDFHILPSGLVNPSCRNLIGSGCVVHIPSFFKELEALQTKHLDTEGRIFLSDRAHVVSDLHILIDRLQEEDKDRWQKMERNAEEEARIADEEEERRADEKWRLENDHAFSSLVKDRDFHDIPKPPYRTISDGAIGTTKKGIGPAYSAKHARSGLRVHHIFNKRLFDSQLRSLALEAKKRYDLDDYDVEEEIVVFDIYRENLAPFVVDAVPLMHDAQNQGLSILVEGANALMLDIDHGTYPYVTSSSTGIGGAFTGLALSPFHVKEIIGVVKAYTTRVGGGPFPTEQHEAYGKKLQSLGREVGVTTGRPRRCGWLDLVVLEYSCAVNHYTVLNLTKLDVLDDFDTIPVAVAYRDTRTNRYLESFPADLAVLDRCEVVYEVFPGWKTSIAGTKSYQDLPEAARDYVEFIEEKVGVKVKYIGTGVEREAMIVR